MCCFKTSFILHLSFLQVRGRDPFLLSQRHSQLGRSRVSALEGIEAVERGRVARRGRKVGVSARMLQGHLLMLLQLRLLLTCCGRRGLFGLKAAAAQGGGGEVLE